ncbi:MAG: sulfotransferase [Planctomycetaceae bacterium]|nr:sulfotransferase [Planctomycetaceae bacterium]
MKPKAPQSSEAAEIDALIGARRHAEALARAERWVARLPRDAGGYLAMVKALLPTGRLAAAADAADKGLRVAPQHPQLQMLRGILDHRLGRSDAAIDRLSRLIATRPPNETEASFALAEALHRAAREEALEGFIAQGGAWLDDERAAVFTARSTARRDPAAAAEALERTARATRSGLLKRIAGFEAVRLLDKAGRYREAFDLASFVHAETTPPFDIGAYEAEVAEQLRQLEKGPAWFAAKAPEVAQTALVVGLPRSGTTLVEQMLDRHPQVSGIGEYEGVFEIHEALVGLGVWPQNLRGLQAADAARIQHRYLEGAAARRRAGAGMTFDKTLHAWRMLPALAAVLPGAAFVHITRSPRDCAISMFLSNFHPNAWGFTRDLASIRRVVRLERLLVRRAIEVLGLRAVSIVYEELVDHPEREIRRALEVLGVPFDPVVLSPEGNTRTVLTLSHEQVRRSINRSSIDRWRNYAFAFDAAWDELG